MSNAMRTGKRWLAGVAAGALGAGVLTFVAAPSASAALSGTVTPVRATVSGTLLDAVPYADLSWTANAAIQNTDSVTVTLTNSISGLADVAIAPKASIGLAATTGTATPGTASPISWENGGQGDRLAAGASTSLTSPFGGNVGVGETASLGIAASLPGTYTVNVLVTRVGTGTIQDVTATFTTSGKPASMTLTPASQNVAVLGVAPLVVTLKDSTGNLTQPNTIDTVTMAKSSSDGLIDPVVMTGTGANSLYAGEAVVAYSASATAGTYTITATPGGTLPSSGVTTQTATVNVSGTVDDSTLTGMAVSVPAVAVNAGGPTNFTSQVPAGTSNVTARISGPAGATVRFAAYGSTALGTIDGVGAGTSRTTSVNFKSVTLNSSGVGTLSYVLGGNLLAANATLTLEQVKADNSAATSGQNLVVTQRQPAVSAGTIIPNPSGAIVAQLGTTTPVTVTVADQFGNPIQGFTVRALRGSTQLSQGTTNAAGQASVSVFGSTGITAGTSEAYTFTAQGPIGGVETATLGLTVLYTATGDVTAMNVVVNSGGGTQTTPVTNTTTAIANIPFVQVPFGGTVASAGTTASTTVYTVASSGAGQSPTGQRVQFTPSAVPANTVTVTVPEGLKVVDGAGLTATLLWSGGAQTVSVPSGQPVYVFGTKTGVFDVTFTSGKITTIAKVAVGTVPLAAYNISATPAARNIEAGAFSTVELKVTDVFGNPVPGIVGGITNSNGNAGSVTGSATGEVLLSGLTSSNFYGTGAAGTSTITLIAGKPGTGTVTFGPTLGGANLAPAWQAGYTPPTGAPAPVTSAAVAIVVTDTPDKVITISGTRGTVSGKSGIIIDGVTDGIENGKTVTPFIRFPGETTFTAGSARPVISGDEFTWQRKTGKRVTVYVELSDDASIRSNRVTIQAS